MVLIIVGVLLISLGVYVKYKAISFKKNGIKVKARVISSERISEFNGMPANGYKTTFELQVDGQNITETIFTNKKFQEGTTKNAAYLKGKKKNTLSVSGEGFYLAKGGEIVIILFGIIFILGGLASGGFISTKALLIAIGCFVAFIFLGIILSGSSKKRSKKKKQVRNLSSDGEPKVKDIISDDGEDEEE